VVCEVACVLCVALMVFEALRPVPSMLVFWGAFVVLLLMVVGLDEARSGA
jgi:hypothetical protein